jgi:hypothetical protein
MLSLVLFTQQYPIYNMQGIIQYFEDLPLNKKPDDVNLLDELLDGVLELAVAGDEGGPELSSHHTCPHPVYIKISSSSSYYNIRKL